MKVRSEQQRVKIAYRAAQNAAQQERNAADDEVKKLADTAKVDGGETWGNASGHSGTRAAWLASAGVALGFLLAGIGMTVGPRLLIWIGVGVIVVVGAVGMLTHVWSDYEPEPVQDEMRSADSAGSAGSAEPGRTGGATESST